MRLGATKSFVFYGNPKPSRGFAWAPETYPVGWDFTGYGLATGDFNRDGRVDYARLGDNVAATRN